MVKNLVVIASSKKQLLSDDSEEEVDNSVVLSEDAFYADCTDVNEKLLSHSAPYLYVPGENTMDAVVRLGVYWSIYYQKAEILDTLCYENDLLYKYKDIVTSSRESFLNLMNRLSLHGKKIKDFPFYLEVLKEEYENLLKRNTNSYYDLVSNYNGILSRMVSYNLDFIDTKRLINIYFLSISQNGLNPCYKNLEILLNTVSPEYVKAVFNRFVFKAAIYTPGIRGNLYNLYISRGLLDRRTARKIRSEQSSNASEAGVNAFLSNYEKYKNAEELLALFQDSKHIDVQRLITRDAPANTLWRFVSFTDYICVNNLKQRMGS
jgi:hypothetical protein